MQLTQPTTRPYLRNTRLPAKSVFAAGGHRNIFAHFSCVFFDHLTFENNLEVICSEGYSRLFHDLSELLLDRLISAYSDSMILVKNSQN